MEFPYPVNVEEISIDRTVRLILITSYLYYKLDISVMSDENFDALCKKLSAHLEDNDMRLTDLGIAGATWLDVDDLKAGSGYAIDFNHPHFPDRVISSAMTMASELGLLED